MFSATVSCGMRFKLWNTKPMYFSRTSLRSSSLRRDTSRPSSLYVPDVGRSRQPRICSIVDLPDPELPITAQNSPLLMRALTPLSACTFSSPMS